MDIIEASRIWQTVMDAEQSANKMLVKLMRHPDTTTEQLAEVHEIASKTSAMLVDVGTKLHAKLLPESNRVAQALRRKVEDRLFPRSKS